jgi:hypothetical protein
MLRPVIAIVGRPNVGKSTLFNRLVGRRQALVRDVPGVTRDRLYGQVHFERWQATVVDTGGFDPGAAEPLIDGVRKQVLTAVAEADLIAFVVDARAGATALDAQIARIRWCSSPTRWTTARRRRSWRSSTRWGSASRSASPESTAGASPRCWRRSAIVRPRQPPSVAARGRWRWR